MGYSQKTDNYELPQYLADDRPSYLGDWNEAMNKLDTGMNDNKKDITDVDNKVFNVTQRLQTTEDNMQTVSQVATEASNTANEALTMIDGRFPVGEGDITNGSITAPKMAPTAINAVLGNLRIRSFNSNDPNADNVGMVCPSGVTVRGSYIPALNLLIVSDFNAADGAVVGHAGLNTPKMLLPSYVPLLTSWLTPGAALWDKPDGTLTWTGFSIGNGRYFTLNNSGEGTFKLAACVMVHLTPYVAGGQTNGNYSDFASNSEVI